MPDLAALDLLPAPIAVLDGSGAIVGTNRAWDHTAELGSLDARRGSWNYLEECKAAARRGCVEADKIAEAISQVLAGAGEPYSCVYPCAFAGRHRWFQATVAPAKYNGRRGAIVMHVDVTALEHDTLTDLANRILFDAQADLSLRNATEAGSAMGILLLDLNRFKPVNDRFGHLAGDHVLRTVAARLQSCIGPGDLPARFGGDEFGVVLAAGSGPAVAQRLMARIRSALEQPIGYQGQVVAIGISIGAGMYPADGDTVAALVAAADARMYGMKRARLIA